MSALRARGFRWLPALACLPAQGHGFGARYDLPLPLALWITGAVSTVVLSFLVMAIAVRPGPGRQTGPRRATVHREISEGLIGAAAIFTARLLAVAGLVLIVVAGLIGNQTPTSNLAPTAIWIAWWVGFSYVSAFIGDAWAVVNPWAATFEAFERLVPDRSGARRPRLRWPEALGAWPAIGLFLVFAWLELVWEGRSIPSRLAGCVIAFSVLTWTGMFLFGRRTWLRHADPFALAFGILARFSPTEVRGDAGSPPRLSLRPPGAGLLQSEDVSPSLVVFVIVMLSTVTFDGLMATPFWQRIEDALYVALPALGSARLAVINTAGLLSFCVIFLGVYRGVMRWTAHASANRMTPDAAARAFVLTLVPIAIAYLVAHYLAYCLIQGQLLVRLASDPFGFGWNIFGTARFRPDVGIVGARFVWYTSLIAIVIGHVIAVTLAHIIALRAFRDPGVAARSQAPMLVLMVAYTMMSLWIVAQPIVE
ncbi:MAG TPA: hypothetical protein VFE23_11635 [Usitatibacter sp.]|nr:hypothetical protein [Usitatibacter sp.]